MDISQEDARNFAMTLNSIGQYVPPMLFSQVVNTKVCQIMQATANGEATIEVKMAAANGSGLVAKTETQMKEGKA